MGRKKKFTDQEMIEALRASGGLIHLAAAKLAAAHPTGTCDWHTVKSRIDSVPSVAEAANTSNDMQLDMSEAKLFYLRDGKPKDGDDAIPYSVQLRAADIHLSSKGGGRGYGQATGRADDPIHSKTTVEERREELRRKLHRLHKHQRN